MHPSLHADDLAPLGNALIADAVDGAVQKETLGFAKRIAFGSYRFTSPTRSGSLPRTGSLPGKANDHTAELS